MIIVRSPLRISFAGGGTDLPSFYREGGGDGYGAVCSMAINKYVYVTVNNLTSFFPHRFRVAYSQTELTQEVASIKHPIVREVLKAMDIHGGIDINVMADVPAGTGLGSSSTFTVSLFHALHAFQNRLAEKGTLASEACRLEIDVLKEPIGKQDQYAAAFGGINLFRFYADERVSVEPVPLAEETERLLHDRLMLFYLGGNRQASAILKEQSEKSTGNRAVLTEMRDQAVKMAGIITGAKSASQLDEMAEVFRRGWELKRGLAQGISSSEIDGVMERAMAAGALGGRLLGAGGTGFLLFYVPPANHGSVRAVMEPYREIHVLKDGLGSTLLYYAN